ncbi:MAG: GHKL domain-containing protein, partial [bacterium]|nr:GHKL domain-containing protein [bacterium]
KPFKITDISKLMEEIIANLTKAVEESSAEITYDPLPSITCDEAQLFRLLQNLVGNAVKFRGAPPPKIHVRVEKKDNYWVFSVRDNGIGIDPRHNTRIFQIFQRLHGRTEYTGTGIGLAICKRIVERHNGRIRVDSKPGQGSTFYFTIPVIHEEVQDD